MRLRALVLATYNSPVVGRTAIPRLIVPTRGKYREVVSARDVDFHHVHVGHDGPRQRSPVGICPHRRSSCCRSWRQQRVGGWRGGRHQHRRISARSIARQRKGRVDLAAVRRRCERARNMPERKYGFHRATGRLQTPAARYTATRLRMRTSPGKHDSGRLIFHIDGVDDEPSRYRNDADRCPIPD